MVAAKIGRASSRIVATKPDVGAINAFTVGDVFQVNFHPDYPDSEWVRSWAYPLRDLADIEMAKEIVATQGSCLGWASATSVEKFGYRTLTVENPPWPEIKEIEHWLNTKTRKPLGARG